MTDLDWLFEPAAPEPEQAQTFACVLVELGPPERVVDQRIIGLGDPLPDPPFGHVWRGMACHTEMTKHLTDEEDQGPEARERRRMRYTRRTQGGV